MSAWSDAVASLAPYAWWKLDETSGTSAADSSGNGRAATYLSTSEITRGRPSLIPGDAGSSVQMTSAFGDVQASSLSYSATSVTYAVTYQSSTVTAARLFAASSWTYFSLQPSIPNCSVVIDLTSITLDYDPRGVMDGAAHLLVLVVKSTSVELWVDGALVASATHSRPSLTLTSTRLAFNGQGVIGAAYDDFALWNASLSASQIETLWTGWSGGAPAVPTISLAGTQQREVGSFNLARNSDLSLSGIQQRESAAFTLAADVIPEVSLTGVEQREVGSFSLGTAATPAATARNRVGGRRRSGIGIVHYSPPIVEPPMPVEAQSRLTARAFGPVTTVGAQPHYDVTEATVEPDRDRIIVGGKDITYFRGVPTPTPDFSLIEPLLYGSGRLVLPQIAAAMEHPGVGALRWLRKGATVKVQRVRDGAVVATDYKGVIVDWTVSGGSLSVQLGGEASGRAALINKQIPLIMRTGDIGRHAFSAIRSLGLPFSPFLGPTTGMSLERFGGTSMLDYINELCARAVRKNGNQFTIMPGADGAYRMELKDRSTIHATAYFDDSRLKPDLRSDIAEEYTRVFGTGTTPSGQKVKNGIYPGLQQSDPPPWPLAPGALFGIGAEGDHVRVLTWSLATFGLLRVPDRPGGYDEDVAEAVEDLQEQAGLPVTGAVNRATWRALFDLDVTGHSLIHTAIYPMAQHRSMPRWHRTPTGALSTKNPHYNPHRLKVDLNVNFGTGFTRQQMRRWAKAEIQQGASDNWVGSLDVNLALIHGEHTPGGTLTEADVMQPRELRPGMNIWAPQFMGGTLFHVSGVEVGDGGRSVRASLDTRARDTMKVWEVITRNRESRVNPARAWINQYRSSTIDKDGITTWDEVGGVIRDGVALAGGEWTVVPVVAGQEGTVSRLRVRLDEAHEFAVAVFGASVSANMLNRRIPAPLAKTRNDRDGSGEPWYEKPALRERLRDRFLLHAVGTHDEPCGYGWSRKFDGNGNPTGARLIGVHLDDASFSYRTFRAPVVYLAVWVPSACNLEPGRVMWHQLEEGS